MVNDEVLEAMTTYGGSFTKQLAVLYRLADRDSRRILTTAFAGYFREYAALAADARKDRPQTTRD